MTDNERLAEFTGLKRGEIAGQEHSYYTKTGKWFCRVIDWNPLEDWNHLKLVLEALVRKMGDTLRLELYYGHGQFGADIVDKEGELISEHKWLPQAIIDAAMEVIKSEGD